MLREQSNPYGKILPEQRIAADRGASVVALVLWNGGWRLGEGERSRDREASHDILVDLNAELGILAVQFYHEMTHSVDPLLPGVYDDQPGARDRPSGIRPFVHSPPTPRRARRADPDAATTR